MRQFALLSSYLEGALYEFLNESMDYCFRITVQREL